MIEKIKYPLIIAHRGFRAKYPENTLAAFQGAMDAGVQMIELDVTLTKDREVVVIHDDTLDRTSDGHGDVNAFTLSELKRLDAGTWFHPGFSGEKIPTLSEVLEQVKGRIFINIEIKSSAFEKGGSRRDDTIENQVMKIVREKKLSDKVIVSSFEPGILENMARMKYPLPISLLSETPADSEIIKLCRRLKVFSWNSDYRCLTQDQIRLMHDEGFRVFAYTVNDPVEIKRLIQMGLDGIFTDDPVLAENALIKQLFF